MEKIRQLLRLSLVNDAGAVNIRAMIGERAYPDELFQIANPVLPCINFDASGGSLEAVVEAWNGSVRTWSWAGKNNGTKGDAWKLHDLLVLHWHQSSFNDSTLARYVHLIQEGDPLDTYDENLRAYAVVANWKLMGAKTS